MKHANVSIFVPHLGCPNDCSFCNQRSITGHTTQPTEADIDNAVAIATSSKSYNGKFTEIAFFGGSFTAIDREYMTYLLGAASKHVVNGRVSGIRISTRPDAINQEILDLLKSYKVSAIELGAQSMLDSVLVANGRGHLSKDVETASKLILKNGFSLGLQMMTGLYKDTDEGAIYTAERIIDLKPDTVRIYPTIVLKETALSNLYYKGLYHPQKLSSAVRLCVTLQQMFKKANVKVIRTGLHTIDESSYVAGPWHPAFSELCESERIFQEIIEECSTQGSYDVYVSPFDISKATGQKKSNVTRLKNMGIDVKFIQDNSVLKNTLKIVKR